MDPSRMAIIHSGAGALATYIIAFYNLGCSLSGQKGYASISEEKSMPNQSQPLNTDSG
jgi:hypothetical protein